ncbi:MAG: hypothetical protein WD904_13870 [Dehalococcoidia bacterium]
MTDRLAPCVAIPTGVPVTSLGDPHQHEIWERKKRLQLVVDYMLAGEETLLVPENKPVGLYPRLRMSQRLTGMGGRLEARILYGPSVSYMEVDVRQAMRRLVWDREADERRCRRRQPAKPDVTSDAFRVPPRTSELIDTVTQGLKDSMSALAATIHLESQRADDDGELRIAQQPIHIRWVSFSSYPASIQLNFLDAAMIPEVNEAWEGLWDALGSIIAPEQQVAARVRYPVSLSSYSRTMTQARA